MPASRSIGRNLAWLSIFSSSSALLAASLALLFFQLQEVKNSLVLRLESVGDLIAFKHRGRRSTSTTPKRRKTMLGALKDAAGGCYRPASFAKWPPPRSLLAATQPRRLREEKIWQSGFGPSVSANHELTVYRPVVFQRPATRGRSSSASTSTNTIRPLRRFALVTALVAIPGAADRPPDLAAAAAHHCQTDPQTSHHSAAHRSSATRLFGARAPVMRSAGGRSNKPRQPRSNQMLAEIEGIRAPTLEQRVADRTKASLGRREIAKLEGILVFGCRTTSVRRCARSTASARRCSPITRRKLDQRGPSTFLRTGCGARHAADVGAHR